MLTDEVRHLVTKLVNPRIVVVAINLRLCVVQQFDALRSEVFEDAQHAHVMSKLKPARSAPDEVDQSRLLELIRR